MFFLNNRKSCGLFFACAIFFTIFLWKGLPHFLAGTVQVVKSEDSKAKTANELLKENKSSIVTVDLHTKKNKSFDNFFRKEVIKVGKIDPNPVATKKLIFDEAQKLTSEEINTLAAKAVDSELEGDERFLAVYILGASKSVLALKKLTRIALAPVSKHRIRQQTYEQEMIIRIHALESLISTNKRLASKHLVDFLAKTDNSLLASRARELLKNI